MNIDFTEDEVRALADVAELAADRDGAPMPLVTAWLKLVRAQAERLAVPARSATLAGHSTPGVGTADSVPAPMPGVTRMGAGTLSSDTWGLR